MKRFLFLLVMILSSVPGLALSEEHRNIQWVDADFQAVPEGDPAAAYYFDPSGSDSESYTGVRIYYDAEGEMAVRSGYAQGVMVHMAEYVDDQQHGKHIRWRMDGSISEEARYVEDARRETQVFHDDGTLKRYVKRDEEGQTVERREYDTSGQLTSLETVEEGEYGLMERQEQYSDGELVSRRLSSKDRRWRVNEQFHSHDRSKLRYREERLDRELHGLQVTRPGWPEGSTEIREFEHGVPVNEHIHTDEEGNLVAGGRYENGHKVGEWLTLSYGNMLHEFYDEDGNLHGERREIDVDGKELMRAHYRHGELHGDYLTRQMWGDQISLQGEYRNGERVGTWREFYDDIQVVFEGEYREGEKEGLWLAHFDDGYERGRLYYKAGLPEGTHYIFSHNGALEQVSRFKDGELHGEQLRYFEGSLSEILRYRDGALHGLSEYFVYGKRSRVWEYADGVLLESSDEY